MFENKKAKRVYGNTLAKKENDATISVNFDYLTCKGRESVW